MVLILALAVGAAAQAAKTPPPARIYAPPRQCYAFNSQGDIYLSCGAELLRVTYRGEIDQFAISTDGRIFAFAAGFGPSGPPRLYIARFGPTGPPRETQKGWPPDNGEVAELAATCGTVVVSVELVPGRWNFTWREIDAATGRPLPNWAGTEPDAAAIHCSADGRTSVWREEKQGGSSEAAELFVGREAGQAQRVRGVLAVSVSPDGHWIACEPKGTGRGAVCVATVAPPHVPACLAYSARSPFTLLVARRLGQPQEISGPVSAGVNDEGASLLSGDWTDKSAPRCYILKQRVYLGQILSTRPKPGYVRMDAPCPALLYWKPGMPMAEILHPEMVPQYAQWVSPTAARRLRAWAARHRPKARQKPR